jgi:hypothetical protein
MATIADAITAVQVNTSRPDKVALITQAVKAFVVKAHAVDFFHRDLVELGATAPGTPGYDVTIALPTRWRKFAYIFQCDSTGLPISGHKGFKFLDPEDVFQYNTSARNEVAYVVGNNVRLINNTTQIDYYRWGFYQKPDASSTATSTWILDNEAMFQGIVDGATMYVHSKLGNTNLARVEQLNWDEWKGMILAEALTDHI